MATFYHTLVKDTLLDKLNKVIAETEAADQAVTNRVLGVFGVGRDPGLSTEKRRAVDDLKRDIEGLDASLKDKPLKENIEELFRKFNERISTIIERHKGRNTGHTKDAYRAASRMTAYTFGTCELFKLLDSEYDPANPLHILTKQLLTYYALRFDSHGTITGAKKALLADQLSKAKRNVDGLDKTSESYLKNYQAHIREALANIERENSRICTEGDTNKLSVPLTGMASLALSARLHLNPSVGVLAQTVTKAKQALSRLPGWTDAFDEAPAFAAETPARLAAEARAAAATGGPSFFSAMPSQGARSHRRSEASLEADSGRSRAEAFADDSEALKEVASRDADTPADTDDDFPFFDDEGDTSSPRAALGTP